MNINHRPIEPVSGVNLDHKISSFNRGSSELLADYQERDREVVDYEMFWLGNTRLLFRGPRPSSLDKGDYFTCIGAAQTFGCFCDDPYPKLLADSLGIEALNLGYGGAGPEFFNRRDDLIEYLNHGRFVIVQAMAGRSQSNSVFYCGGLESQVRRSDRHSMGADTAYAEFMAGSSWLRSLPPEILTSKFAKLIRRPRVGNLLVETRKNWIESHRSLFSKVKVPIIFFWYSKRSPDYEVSLSSQWGMFGEFPQMIDRETVDSVVGMSDRYVECVTKRGSPQRLYSRFTGAEVEVNPAEVRPDLRVRKAWTHNGYYPSPEMHEDALRSLLKTCEELLGNPGIRQLQTRK